MIGSTLTKEEKKMSTFYERPGIHEEDNLSLIIEDGLDLLGRLAKSASMINLTRVYALEKIFTAIGSEIGSEAEEITDTIEELGLSEQEKDKLNKKIQRILVAALEDASKIASEIHKEHEDFIEVIKINYKGE
jgi:hypothetical protein